MLLSEMRLKTECDVLVVGAGPAGSAASLAAAQRGARVIMIDKRTEVGRPVQCAEHIPRPLAMEVSLSEEAVAQEVLGTDVYIEGRKELVVGAPGWILNREVFDGDLARAAADGGVELLLDTRAVDRSEDGVLVSQNGREREVTCKIIVGADGPASTVAEWIGQRNERLVNALQATFPLSRPLENCQVYFARELEGGYGWVFPKGLLANVGVGVVSGGSSLHDLLNGFVGYLRDQDRIAAEEVRTTAGLIPVGGPLRTVAKNIVLAGDAAGHTHPITGAGIPQAVVCGKMAGRAAAAAALKDDLSLLGSYEKEWQTL